MLKNYLNPQKYINLKFIKNRNLLKNGVKKIRLNFLISNTKIIFNYL